jgi:hypothetical protein
MPEDKYSVQEVARLVFYTVLGTASVSIIVFAGMELYFHQ